MMKNYWNILQDHACFEYQFVLDKNDYDIELIKELLSVIVFSGWEYRILKLLDKESGCIYCEDYLEIFNSILDKKRNVDSLEKNFSFFQQAFPDDGYQNPHVIVTELAFYNQNGEIEIKDIFKNTAFYSLLNPYRVHLYHYLETDAYSPISFELLTTSNKELKLRIASGLSIWLPYFKPDYDMDRQKIEDFPLNKTGYIDNRELYLLNTPRLIGFIKVIRSFFEGNNGKELSSNTQLEKLPKFPWYYS